MSFKAEENKHLKIHMKQKKKMDIPIDADYINEKNGKIVKVKKLPKELPNKSFVHLLYGPPGSGKSSYIHSLVCSNHDKGHRQSYKNLFKKIIFFTPPLSQDFA